jgi:hypothetical protein
MNIPSKLLRSINSFPRTKLLQQAWFVVCMSFLFATSSGAQGVNDVPPEPGNAANISAPKVRVDSPVTVSHHGVTEEDLQPVESAIQFALLACGIWSIVSGIRREKGGKISIPFIVLGSLILIDAGAFQNQLNWWWASPGEPYQPAIGTSVPGTLGGVLFLVRALLQPNQGRPNRTALILIALAIVAASISLSCLVWPQHPSQPQGFS